MDFMSIQLRFVHKENTNILLALLFINCLTIYWLKPRWHIFKSINNVFVL